MNKKNFAAKSGALLLAIAAVACSNAKTESTEVANTTATELSGDNFAPTTNIRYYDMDTVMAKYNLVKDLNEVSLRTVSNLQNAQRAKEAELQKLAASIDQKMRNNGYLSEQSYNADVQNLQKKQAEAQNYIAALQNSAAEEADQQQRQFLDSLNTFLMTYNETHHFDAILIKSPGVYFNPALDITSDIVNGLNARYVKVNETK